VSFSPTPYLTEMESIAPPAETSSRTEFIDLCVNVVGRHVASGASQRGRHREMAATIQKVVDASQALLDFYGDRRPTTPHDRAVQARRIREAADSRRAYAQLLDTLKRACGALCCPDDASEHPDPCR
jgi:hypothetical protein